MSQNTPGGAPSPESRSGQPKVDPAKVNEPPNTPPPSKPTPDKPGPRETGAGAQDEAETQGE